MRLKVEGATVHYPAGPALAGVTLAVAAGEFLGIIGPNGAGKSTLLRALTGAVRPRPGEVALDGRPVRSLTAAELARAVALVAQDERPEFAFAVRDLVLMGRLPHLSRWQREGPADRAAADRAMAATATAHLAHRPVTELSGGEARRVTIARALAQETGLLLLDEPTAHLDIRHQVKVMDLLRHLVQSGRLTAVAVLHDLNLAALYCTRLLLLGAGRIEAAGPPAEVLTPPHIRRVYGAAVAVVPHPVTGGPVVCPLPGQTQF